MSEGIQLSLLEYEGKPFDKGLFAVVYKPNSIELDYHWVDIRKAISEIEKTAGSQSVAVQVGNAVYCVPMNVSALKQEITTQDYNRTNSWSLVNDSKYLDPKDPADRQVIRLLFAKAISNQQLARGWFVEAFQRVYYWSFTLSEKLSMGLMDVYPGFIFKPYVYDDGSCAVILDPKFRFVGRVTLREIIDDMLASGKSANQIQNEFCGTVIVDACPIIDCPFRKNPSSLCRLRGAGRRHTLLGFDFDRSPSKAKFGNLIDHHFRKVCPNQGILGASIKDEVPIALIEKMDSEEALEFPLERLRKELALKELDKFGRYFVSKYVRPSPRERWYLTRGFTSYLDGVRIGRLPPLKLVPRLVSAGSVGKFWSYCGSFNELPLKFRDGNTGAEAFNSLERYGPYDLSDGRFRRKFDELSISIHDFSRSLEREDFQRFYSDLVKGLLRSNYPGLERLFKLYIPPFTERIVKHNSYELDVNVRRPSHVVVIVTEPTGSKRVLQYKPFKQKLTQIGVPCQFVLEQNIGRNVPNQKYSGYLRNLALNIYAKIGGIPWILGRPISNNKCFVGLASIGYRGRVYFSTQVFNSEGLWLGGRTRCVIRDRYPRELSEALSGVINLYTSGQREPPDEVVIHKEGEIWENLELNSILELGSSVRIVSVKKTGLPRMYDMKVPSLMVSRGTYVHFDSNAAVVATSGAPHMIPQGTQRPLLVEIKNEKAGTSLLRETCREIFLLSLVFSGYTYAVTSDPVTTLFAGKAAELSANYDLEENIALQKKAWFL